MIIDVTGFGYSGSGAYLDLIREYSETEFPWSEDFELSILHNVDGIMDLNYKLTNKHCRIFDSDVAIKRFLCLVKNHYDMRGDLRGKSFPICRAYIDNLIGIKFKSQSIYDMVYFQDLKSSIIKYYNLFVSGIFKNGLSKRLFDAGISERFKMSNINTKYLSYNPDNFLEATRQMMDELISIKRKNADKILITDHLLPPDNPNPYFDFINDNVKSIIVRRDPRDTYILAKEIYKGKVPIPVEDVRDFIWFYKHTVENTLIENTNRVLCVNFEDLIYDYERTVQNIELFCNLTDHNNPRKYLNPQNSINNTQLYKIFNKYEDDIRKIETQLPNSLFDFEKFGCQLSRSSKVF